MSNEAIYSGNDVFFYDLDDGVVEFDVGNGKDIVRLGAGITPKSPIELFQVNYDGENWLEILFGDGQVLTLRGFVDGKASIVFSDGSVWDSAYVNRLMNVSRHTGFDTMQVGDSKTKKLVGGALDDLLIAGPINTTLEGGAGNDYLEGGKGKDTLLGGAGNDYLDGGAGNDQLSGGDGDDYLLATTGADVLDGGNGNDCLTAMGSKQKLLGGAGNDCFDVEGNDDTVDGGSDNDWIYVGGQRAQILFGKGSGQDTILGGGDDSLGKAYTIRLGAGIKASDLSFAKERIEYDDGYVAENLKISIGGTGDALTVVEFFNMAATTHTLYAPFLIFADGSNMSVAKILNGPTADVIYATRKKDTFTLTRGIGSDSVVGFANNDLVQLGSGIALTDLTIRSTAFGDLSLALPGSNDSLRLDDFFDGNPPASTVVVRAADGSTLTASQLRMLALVGKNQDDVIHGFGTNDSIFAGNGNDRVFGGGGRDTLDGGAGDDELVGAGLLIGGEGDDTLSSGGGAVTLQGGAGDDRIILGEDSTGVETVRFGLGDGRDRIDYFAVGDVLELGTGVTVNDLSIRTNQGVFSSDEFLIGGVITLQDGSSFEVFGISDSSSATAVRFADGGTLSHKQLYALFLRGTSGDDWLLDSHLNDRITGLGGNDTIGAYYGDDTLEGGDGQDYLSDLSGSNILLGGAGNDVLDAGGAESGSNILNGGKGNDTIYGGARSADRFIFNPGDGRDVALFYAAAHNVVVKADIVQLGVGNASEVTTRRSGTDLELGFAGRSDVLVVADWYADDSIARRSVDHFELSDGSRLSFTGADALVSAMAAFDPPAAGSAAIAHAYRTETVPSMAAH